MAEKKGTQYKKKMKKLFFISMIVFLSLSLNAQNKVDFQINNNSVFVIPNSDKDYYVFNFKGKSAAQLYKSALKSVTKRYVDSEDEISKVPNQLLTINSSVTYTKQVFGGGYSDRRIYYAYNIEFKAGKIRINSPRILRVYFIDDDEEHPFSYIRVNSLSYMNSWFTKMNETINKVIEDIEGKGDNDW
jgi:hypothetical protein